MRQYYCESATKRTSSRQQDYFTLLLNDSTEKISVSVWDAPSNIQPQDLQGKVLLIAEIRENNGFKNARWSDIGISEKSDLAEDSPLRKIKTESDVTVDMLVKAAESFLPSFPERWQKFAEFLNFRSLFDMFGNTPAGKQIHHSINKGLCEHVYEMLSLYKALSKSYVMKDIRHEFIVFGICVHDLGKVCEYRESEGWACTEEMALMGHHYMSAHWLHNKLVAYNEQAEDNFKLSDREIECCVHCILSHHGQLEWGAVTVPAIEEAWILHSVDELSGKLNQFRNATHMEKSFFLNTYVVRDKQ